MVLEEASSPSSAMEFPPDTSPTSDADPYASGSDMAGSTTQRYTYAINGSRLALPYLGWMIGYTPTFRSNVIAARMHFMTNAIQRPLTTDEAQALAEHTARLVALSGDMTVLGAVPGLWRAYATRKTFRFPFNALKVGDVGAVASEGSSGAAAAAGGGGGGGGEGGGETSGEKPAGTKSQFNPNRFLGLRGLNAQYAWHICRAGSYVLVAMAFSHLFAQSYAATVTSVHETRDPRLEDVERRVMQKVVEERLKRRGGTGSPQQRKPGMSNAYGDVDDDASPTGGQGAGGIDEQTTAEFAALSGANRDAGDGGEMLSERQMRAQETRQRAGSSSMKRRIGSRSTNEMERGEGPPGSFVDDDDATFIGGGIDGGDDDAARSSTATTATGGGSYDSSSSRRTVGVSRGGMGMGMGMEPRDDSSGGGGSAWDRIRQRSSSSSTSDRDGWTTTPSSSSSSASSSQPISVMDDKNDERGRESVWAQRRQRAMNPSREE